MRTLTAFLVAALASAATIAGCAKSPRQRPLPTDRIETGTDSVQATRKALEGRWRLLSLDVAAADGRRAQVAADGELSMDAYGNLHIEYRVRDEGRATLESIGVESPNPVISTDGQVVIDPAERRITYVGRDRAEQTFNPEIAARRANPFALERVRHYTFDDDGTLTLRTRHDDGRDASTSRWRKVR